MKPALLLALLLCAAPLCAAPISPAVHDAIMVIADECGVPRSVANWLQVEESGNRWTGCWGDAEAINHNEAGGWPSKGLYQLYTKPSNLAWLLNNYYAGDPAHFDIFCPVCNAMVALGYLAALHDRYKTWERALWAYNCGRVVDVPESTRRYARRIVDAGEP